MARVRIASFALLCTVLLVACGSNGQGPGSGTQTPSSVPLAPVDLRLLLIDHVGKDFVYCDPDEYPVGRGTELQHARRNRAAMEADPAYPAILGHLGIALDATLTDRQLVAAYRLFKELRFVDLRPVGDGYRFRIRLQDRTLMGTISAAGSIHETASSPNPFGCPICLARGTRIAAPGGSIPVQDVRVGMSVWSTDAAGRRMRAVVVAVGRTPVPPAHEVVRLVLADGRTVLVSPGHPTPDGRTVGELRRGEAFEGTTVVSTERVRYGGAFTYDLLPSGPAGTYFADGVLLASTLSR